MIRRKFASQYGTTRPTHPALVVTDVVLSDLLGNHHPIPWDAMVDTGADWTVIPATVCRRLGLPKRGEREFGAFDRAVFVKAELYYVSIGVPGVEEVAMLVAAMDRDSVLLGRDFLAKLGLMLAADSRTGKWQCGKSGCCSSAVMGLLALC